MAGVVEVDTQLRQVFKFPFFVDTSHTRPQPVSLCIIMLIIFCTTKVDKVLEF